MFAMNLIYSGVSGVWTHGDLTVCTPLTLGSPSVDLVASLGDTAMVEIKAGCMSLDYPRLDMWLPSHLTL